MPCCRFYAHDGSSGVLRPNPGSDQCALIVTGYSTCAEELDGNPPDEVWCHTVSHRANYVANLLYTISDVDERERLRAMSDPDRAQFWIESANRGQSFERSPSLGATLPEGTPDPDAARREKL